MLTMIVDPLEYHSGSDKVKNEYSIDLGVWDGRLSTNFLGLYQNAGHMSELVMEPDSSVKLR
jgi:hypothetical protein